MTLYYDKEKEALVENHPDEFVSYDDEDRMVFDLSDFHKRDSLKMVVDQMERYQSE